MPEQQTQPRQTAYKVSIKDILSNNYVQQEGWQPNYIQIQEKQVSRVNLIATVIDKINSSSLITLTLDDGTGNIQAKSFNEDIRKLININIGDLLLIIGRPRKYNEQLFISVEIARKLPEIWSKIRKLELGIKEPLEKIEIKETNLKKQKILEAIKKLDNGKGAEITEIMKTIALPEEQGEALIEELIKQGEVYENSPNYIKAID